VLPKLLLVDDDEELCQQMRWALANDYNVFVATERQGALDIFKRERPAVVTLDLGLPPDPHGVTEGFCTLYDILHEDAKTKVIVITGREERQHAYEAVGQGAYDFFRKPIDIDELSILMRRALHVYRLEQEHRTSERQVHSEVFEGMLGGSPQMQEVFETIRRVAIADVPVLINGESGTGKELVAQAIHRRSARRDGPFVAINCGAIPENLLESELFGYEKGAFTGAYKQRKGRIELAQGGTLFLDEIGELPLPLQVKLLRFLQEHQVERIGGHHLINIHTRVLAATNVELGQAVASGRFREDLYYRLAVMCISLPPLRDRDGDVVLLARSLLQRCAAEMKSKITHFDRSALVALQRYKWPGNVRELENYIKRALIMARGKRLSAEDLNLPLLEVYPISQTLQEARQSVEKDLILHALANNEANISRAATALGVSRPTLHDLLTKYGIRR
jgi:two-component system NtrC family response regulator